MLLSIEDLIIGDVVDIDVNSHTKNNSTITYIGKDVGAYIDRFGTEFTFATNSVKFYTNVHSVVSDRITHDNKFLTLWNDISDIHCELSKTNIILSDKLLNVLTSLHNLQDNYYENYRNNVRR